MFELVLLFTRDVG